MQEKQRQTELVERAAAQVYRPAPPLSPASMDFAIAEITARQNELDSPPPRQMPPRNGAPTAAPAAPAGPDFSSLERHLIQITSQIEALQRPDHVEESIAAFRSELAEIRQAITEAVPRRGDRIARERNPLAVPPHRRQPPARQRWPDAGRHRARARRNPRSIALADAGRTAHRLRRGDPQSRRQARPDPALERRSVDRAAARERDRGAAWNRLQRRLQRRVVAARRGRAHAVGQGRPAFPLRRQQRCLGTARAAPDRADSDAGNKASAGRERQFGISRKRVAHAVGTARPYPGRRRQCVGVRPSRTARILPAGTPGSFQRPFRRADRRPRTGRGRTARYSAFARTPARQPGCARRNQP